MKAFLDKDFLLDNDKAKVLYHNIAENLPIIDYHCHLNPQDIANNRRFNNLTEAWLDTDHYKWRLMRINGVDEDSITGNAGDYERFMAWARTISYAAGNPLLHWAHMELKRYFGIDEILTEKTAPDIWEKANAALRSQNFGVQGLIARMHVKALCTTDDPTYHLEWHAKIKENPDIPYKVYPTWRPDKVMDILNPGFARYISCLSDAADMQIKGWDSLLEALDKRMEFFNTMGCRISDHAFEKLAFEKTSRENAAKIFERALSGAYVSGIEAEQYKSQLLLYFAERYTRRDWAMQLHIGALRNCNSRMFQRLGPDTGFDASADHALGRSLVSLLDAFASGDRLPKTILYTLNPKDNYVISTVMGCFQGGGIPGKVQFGSAWWFIDHKDGMEKHIHDLASLAMLSRCIGMLTDSRSFLSFPRHEYFRRILCNILGRWVENGEFPDDNAILSQIVRGICLENAENYFNFV